MLDSDIPRIHRCQYKCYITLTLRNVKRVSDVTEPFWILRREIIKNEWFVGCRCRTPRNQGCRSVEREISGIENFPQDKEWQRREDREMEVPRVRALLLLQPRLDPEMPLRRLQRSSDLRLISSIVDTPKFVTKSRILRWGDRGVIRIH